MDLHQFSMLSDDEKKRRITDLIQKRIQIQQDEEKVVRNVSVLKCEYEERNVPFPLTDIQESFVVGRLLGGKDKSGCHFYCEFEAEGLEADRLKDTWNQLVIHHDMLHTMIQSDGKQCIMAEIPEYEIPVHDLQKSDDEDVTKHIDAIRDQLSHKVYEPNQWPLFEIHISLLPHRKVLVHMSIDEWIVDAASVDLLLNQWYRLYHDPEYTLPVLDVSFRDVVMAWKEFEHSPVFQRDLTYWMEKLKEIPDGPNLTTSTPELLEGKSYVPRSRYRGRLEKPTWDRLKQKAVELNVSPTVLLLTLFSKVLAEYSHSKEFSLILTFFNRLPLHPQLDQVVGPFISTNIFVANQTNTGWETQAKEYQIQVWEDLDHSSVSGIRAIRELRTRKLSSSIPPIPVVFTSMLNNVGKNGTETQTWFNHLTYNITQTPQVYLDHQVMEREGNLEFNWDIAEGYIPKYIVDKMFSRYLSLLQESDQEESQYEEPSSPSTKEKGGSFGLTDLQQTYVLGRLQGSGNGNNCQMYQEFKVEDLDLSRLSQVWNRLIAHHDMLRAVVNEDGTQKILSDVSPYEIIINNAFQASQDTEACIEGVRNEMAQHVFPLGKWPLFDLRVTRIDEKKACIHLCTDALIADGGSLFLLYQQLFDLYQQPGSSLPELTFSYRDYVGFKKEKKHSVEYKEACLYWETKMKSISRGPTFKRDVRHTEERIRMEGTLTNWNSLKKIAKNKEVTPGVVLFTVYQDILTSYLPSPFTTVVVNWDRLSIHREIEQIMGDFTALSWVQSAPSHLAFIDRVRKNQIEIRQDISHGLVSGLHGLRKRAMENKEEGFLNFPIVFTNLLDDQVFDLPSSWELGYGASKTPGVVLDNISFEVGKSLHFHWDIMKDVFPSHVQEEMFDLYRQRLTDLSTDESRWDEVQGESANENLNKGQGEHMKETQSELCLHQWFEQQVQIRPNAIALKWEQQVITYQELNERANQVAHYLHSCGVGPDVMVGICVNRSIEMVAGILGILKAGGAYVPLDPSHPRERLGFILEDSQVSMILTQKDTESSLPDTNTRIIRLDQESDLFKDQPISNISIQMNSHHLAYVIYTSGSTGTPKGVLITHQNVVRLFTQTEKWYGFNHQDVWILYHSYAFDFSVWEIFGSLLYGGKLVIVPYKVSRSFESFYNLLSQEQVTVLNQTPTAFRQLISVEDQALTPRPLALRYVIFGGEALDPRMLKPWFTRHGDQTPQLVNMYGITETTVHVTYRPLTVQDTLRQDSVIGHPIPDLHVHILDENLQPVPTGTVGEMYIGGEGVARGYLNREQLDKERFIKNPFTAKQERLYKSGDLARYNEKHEIEFIGRNDHQVKVRGFRIELGEIETILNSHDSIEDSVVTVKYDDNGEPQIVAYIVSKGILSSTTIRKYVRTQVPVYMVPNIIIKVDQIPMNVNGKLDYQALPWPVSDTFNHKKDEANQQKNKDATEMITKYFKEVLDLQDINPEEDIFNLGATSLTIVNVAQRIKEQEGVVLPVEVILEHSTINDMAAQLCIKEQEPTSSVDSLLPDQEAKEMSNYQSIYKDFTIDLPVEKYAPTYYKAYSVQSKLKNIPININDVSGLLSLLKRQEVDGIKKYLYPSAGGKYAVQTYIYVKENGIDGLEEGMYYYHPENHDLKILSKECGIESNVFSEYHRETFNNAKFAIFFIVEMDAIQPFYQKFSHSLATLDSGYMSQLLLSNQSKYNIGLYPAIGVDFESIRDYFKLKPSHKFIHSLLGGHVNYEEEQEEQDGLIELDEKKLINHIQNPSFISTKHIENMYENMQYHGLSEEEVRELSKQELQFRNDINQGRTIPLKSIQYNKSEFYARSCQRSYQKKHISLEQLGNYLTLLKSNTNNKNYKYLYPSVGKQYEINAYIYINEDKVESIQAGVYKYDRETHSLEKVSGALSSPIKNCYTPFNRPHLKDAAFCIFLIADLEKMERDFKQISLHSALLEAGHMGQLLVDRQADYDIGIVPIGGVNFEAIRSDFKLSDTNYMIHSFIGGFYEQQHKKADNLKEYHSSMESKNVANSQQKASRESLDEVAIIGLSGRYAESYSVQDLWGNLIDSKDCIKEVPLERWDAKEYYQNEIEARNSKSKHGGFLQDIDKFDSLFFGIPPSEAIYMDPQVRIALETVWHALEDAGYTKERLVKLQESGEKVGVFIGSMYQHYHLLAGSNDLQAMLAIQSYSAIANRISHFYNFQGPSVAVDTACSSSLLALHTACESIKRKECTTAVVVGVNLSLHPGKYVSLTNLGLLGSDTSSQSFHNSDGFVPGEGVGAVLIKAVPEAEEAQDNIYCVVKGSSMNHSGNVGAYSTPSVKAQQSLIRDTLTKTNISPETISYIESGANGSPIGDSIEVGALTKAFLGFSNKKQYCSIGSVKSNIGHLEAASGIAQLTKVILQMKYKTLVPTLQYENINPFIDFESTPFYLQTKVEKWERPVLEKDGKQIEYPLRAGVCSFAAGGSNVFVILEEYIPKQRREIESREDALILLSAKNEEALREQVNNLRVHLLNHVDINIDDVSHTLIYGREHMEVRLALIAETREGLLEKLEAIQAGEENIPHVLRGTVTSDKDGYTMFEDDEEYQLLLNKWLEKRDLIRISKVWVKGVRLDWTRFKKYTSQKTVSLPGYPFARESYWINSETNAVQEKKLLSIESSETQSSETNKLKIEEDLVESISKMLQIPVEKIDVDKSLRMYGFNSLYAMKLVNTLEQKGYKNLSAKIVLQTSTIREICGCLKEMEIYSSSIQQSEKEIIENIEEPSLDEKIIQLLMSEVTKGTITPEEAIRVEDRILTTK